MAIAEKIAGCTLYLRMKVKARVGTHSLPNRICALILKSLAKQRNDLSQMVNGGGLPLLKTLNHFVYRRSSDIISSTINGRYRVKISIIFSSINSKNVFYQ